MSATSRWTDALASLTAEFSKAFGHLTPEQMNWKPGPDRWSIGQVIEHLIVTNETYYPILDQLHRNHYRPHFLSRFGLLANFFGNQVLKTVQPEAKRKQKTFPVFEPSQSTVSGDIVARFARHQGQMISKIQGSESHLNRIISSPAKAFLVYPLDRAWDIVVAHEQRHLLQARAVLAQLPAR